ncbi:MAG: chromosomal replication initiator protein DnaA [Solirubrobacteraceae bacterium]
MEPPAQLELARASRHIHDDLRRAVGASTFEIWLRSLQVVAWDGSVLLLEAPPAIRTWVADRFGPVIERSAHATFGPHARIAFAPAGEPAGAPAGDPHAFEELERFDHFNPRYNFSQFVMGDGNHLAHAAALAVAENPGHAYNPLFLHGPPGLGKTHLLHAIANYIATFSPTTVVHYTTVEAFTNNFISALGTKSLARFKHLYRNVDVLLIDDVQFLASKAKTEEEFFHTFNAVYEFGHQLVLTCDRLPNQLLTLEDRLRDRFQSGLVAQISPPDYATRVAILRKRVELDRITIDDHVVIELLASRVTDNIRSLEGALIRLVAQHSLTGHPIDADLTGTLLDAIHPQPNGVTQPTIDHIQRSVEDHFSLPPGALASPSRTAAVSWPRHLAMQLCRDLTESSSTAIGAAFGGRSHATVLNACKRVSDKVASDPAAASELASLHAELTVGRP